MTPEQCKAIIKSLLERKAKFKHEMMGNIAYQFVTLMIVFMLLSYQVYKAEFLGVLPTTFLDIFWKALSALFTLSPDELFQFFTVLSAGYSSILAIALTGPTHDFLIENYSRCLITEPLNDLRYVKNELNEHANLDLNDEKAVRDLYNSFPFAFKLRLELDYKREQMGKTMLLTSNQKNGARIQQLPTDLKKLILDEALGIQNSTLLFNSIKRKKEADAAPTAQPRRTLPVVNVP